MFSTKQTEISVSEPVSVAVRRPRRRLTKALLAVMSGLIGLLLIPGTANAGTAWTGSGVYGHVREAVSPAVCYNSAYGYFIRASGPAAWARALTNGEQKQYVRWAPILVDSTTGQTSTPGWSNWSLASTTQGVQFDNDLIKGTRGDTLQIIDVVQWYSPSYGRVIGSLNWVVTSYSIPDQGRIASSC